MKRVQTPVKIPRDLEIALAKSPSAQAVWDKIPPSHKREYIKWIEEAKKPKTRLRRVEQSTERLVSSSKK